MFVSLGDLPKDPIARIEALADVERALLDAVEQEYQRAYFDARLAGRMDEAFALKVHPKKMALAFTRAENEARGRSVRWSLHT